MTDATRVCSIRRLLAVLAAAALLGLVAPAAFATVYKYVDRDGASHYTDSVSSIPAQYRNQVKDITDDLARMDGFRVVQGVDGPEPRAANEEETGIDTFGLDLGGLEDLGFEGGDAMTDMMESLGFGVLLLGLLAIPVLFVVSGLVLKLACHIAGEEPPGLGRACGILFAQGLLGGAVGVAVGGTGMALGIDESASIASSLAVSGASTLLSWMANAGLLVSMMGYGFGKSLWIGLLHTLLVIVMIGGPIGGVVLIGMFLA